MLLRGTLRRFFTPLGVGLLTLALAQCGAKTGLRIDHYVWCSEAPFRFDRPTVEAFLVLDRSNSMNTPISDALPLTRWDALGDAVAIAFSSADPTIRFGGKIFPGTDPLEPCTVTPELDTRPSMTGDDELLALLRATRPAGGTPTARALETVVDYVRRTDAGGQARVAVLATDGGPNCIEEDWVDWTTCQCTARDVGLCRDNPEGRRNCLDETFVFRAIDALREQGVPLYVLGIADPEIPALDDVLNRMAVAGGRPRTIPGESAYYSAIDPVALMRALTQITTEIGRCTVSAHRRVDDLDTMRVDLGRETIPRDRTRTSGWDITDSQTGEVTFYGEACVRVATSNAPITAVAPCPDAGVLDAARRD